MRFACMQSQMSISSQANQLRNGNGVKRACLDACLPLLVCTGQGSYPDITASSVFIVCYRGAIID